MMTSLQGDMLRLLSYLSTVLLHDRVARSCPQTDAGLRSFPMNFRLTTPIKSDEINVNVSKSIIIVPPDVQWSLQASFSSPFYSSVSLMYNVTIINAVFTLKLQSACIHACMRTSPILEAIQTRFVLRASQYCIINLHA